MKHKITKSGNIVCLGLISACYFAETGFEFSYAGFVISALHATMCVFEYLRTE